MPNWPTKAGSPRLRAAVLTACVLGSGAAGAQVTPERLELLERRVDKITELTLQLDQLRRENRELRGQIELQQHAIETLKRQQRDIYQDIDQRLSQLQGGGPESAAAGASRAETAESEPVDVPTRPTPGTTADPAREQADYQAAYDLLRPEQRRYEEAVAAFTAFLEKYPNGRLADNARYWLAEAHYVLQDNDAARAQFLELIQQYPDSPKVAGAKLKLGYLEHAAGNLDAARQYLDEVVRDYPGTAAANMARQRLERIAREAR